MVPGGVDHRRHRRRRVTPPHDHNVGVRRRLHRRIRHLHRLTGLRYRVRLLTERRRARAPRGTERGELHDPRARAAERRGRVVAAGRGHRPVLGDVAGAGDHTPRVVRALRRERRRSRAAAHQELVGPGRRDGPAVRGRRRAGGRSRHVERRGRVQPAVVEDPDVGARHRTVERHRDLVRTRGRRVDVRCVVDRLTHSRAARRRRRDLVTVARGVDHRRDGRRRVAPTDDHDVRVRGRFRRRIRHLHRLTRLRNTVRLLTEHRRRRGAARRRQRHQRRRHGQECDRARRRAPHRCSPRERAAWSCPHRDPPSPGPVTSGCHGT